MKCMILAAGRGERLRPITDSIPKPLVEVCGKPLIVYHIEKLRSCGITDIVINTAWLGEKLAAYLGTGEKFGVHISWSHEVPGGLETAGGLRHAIDLLGTEPFLVVNGDTYIDADYHDFMSCCLNGMKAHLWFIEKAAHNPQGDFDLEGGLVTANRRYTFSGVAVYDPAAIMEIPDERQPLKPWFVKWISERKISGEILKGKWFDVGTIERLNEVSDYIANNIKQE